MQISSPHPASASASSVGSKLRNSRLEHGLSLEDVAQQLRIQRTYLAALETGDFDSLPALTYAIGYVRSYARLLDLDAEALIAEFKTETRRLQEPAQLSFPSPAPEGKVPGGALMFVGALIAALGYGGWYYLSTSGTQIAKIIPPVPERLAFLLEEPVIDGPASGIPAKAAPATTTRAPRTAPPDAARSGTALPATLPATLPDTLRAGAEGPATGADAGAAPSPPSGAAALTAPGPESLPATDIPAETTRPLLAAAPRPARTQTAVTPAPESVPEITPASAAENAAGGVATADSETQIAAATISGEAYGPVLPLARKDATPGQQPVDEQTRDNQAQNNQTGDTRVTLPAASQPGNAPSAPPSGEAPLTIAARTANAQPPAPEAPPAAPPSSTAPAAIGATIPTPTQTAPPTTSQTTTGAAAATTQAIPAVPEVPPAARTVTASRSAAEAEAAETATISSLTATAERGPRIVIRATGDSWVQVRGEDTAPLLTRILRKGEEYEVPLRTGLRLFTGNAGALRISVDGAEAPSLGPFGKIARDIPLDESLLTYTASD